MEIKDIVRATLHEVMLNDSAVRCKADPQTVKEHSDFISKQAQVNKQILDCLETLKKTREEQYNKINEMSLAIARLETKDNISKDNTARLISIIGVIIAIMAILIKVIK